MGHKSFAALTIIFLTLAWLSWKGDKQKDEKLTSPAASTVAIAARANTSVNTVAASTNQYVNIDRTLQIVAEKWKTTDVDGDGLYNCIDAAVLFYKYYPDRSKVAIIINVNPKTGMNHLFNAVLINGVWQGIEPQAYATNHKSYWMKDVWGNKYDNSYNKVANESDARYAR